MGILFSLTPGLCPVFLLLLLLTSPAQAQDYAWTPGLQRAYADLIRLKVEPARQTLSAEAGHTGLRIYLDDYADMLTLLVSDDDRALARLADREDSRLAQLDKLDDRSPYHRFVKAEVRLHWAFVKLKFGKEVSACWDIIRAYRLLAENRKLFPQFLPTYKSLGALHVMIGSVPDNYTWVTNLLGLRGNVRQGLQEISRAQQDPLFRTEAQLIDVLIRAYVTRFTNADDVRLTQLVRDHPDNLLIHFFAATTRMKNGQSEEALTLLLHRPGGPAYLPIPVTDNLLGDIYLQKGQFSRALTAYGQFLATYKGQNFLKDSYYKQFLCYWLLGDEARSRPLLQRVLTVGRATVESDKAAQKFAETYTRTALSPGQKVLMRARLASDGGYLDSALAVLRPFTEASFSENSQKAEYTYRMGRIQQRRNEPAAAIPYFERTITLADGSREPLSFGASAALQLGYIYQQQRNVAQAKRYFTKALSYKKHEYKNSVDNKARAALNELGA